MFKKMVSIWKDSYSWVTTWCEEHRFAGAICVGMVTYTLTLAMTFLAFFALAKLDDYKLRKLEENIHGEQTTKTTV